MTSNQRPTHPRSTDNDVASHPSWSVPPNRSINSKMNPESLQRSVAASDDSLRYPNAESQNESGPTSEPWTRLRQRSDSNGSTCGAFYHTRSTSGHVVAQRNEPEFAVLSQGLPGANDQLPLREHSAVMIQTLPQRNEFFPSHDQYPSSDSAYVLPVYPSEQQVPRPSVMLRDDEDLNRHAAHHVLWNDEHHGSNSSFVVSYASLDRSNSLYFSGSNYPLDDPSYGASAVAATPNRPDRTYSNGAYSYAAIQDSTLYGADFSESIRDGRLGHLLPLQPLPPNAPPGDDVHTFSSMVHAGVEHSPAHNASFTRKHPVNDFANRVYSADASDETPVTNVSECTKLSVGTDDPRNLTCLRTFVAMFDLTNWLVKDAVLDETTGVRYFSENRTSPVASFIRHYFYNPLSPEFTSLQQFDWAVVLGVAMGFFTAYWKLFIDAGVEFVWVALPKQLLTWGIFTLPDGSFPLHHYMWIAPSLFGGVLSYMFAVLQCPDQNQWISSVHTRGIQRHGTFFSLFFLSTFGMWSGMSLGPELPLVLLGGMVGSRLALATRQSVLQARVMNLTAASAAVSGFFGFPMAGALFVLELPHRMGLQYFEALSPATISSIVAVLANRLVTGNDVTGYYRYPWLETTLPSSIFTYAIVYGFYGSLVGIFYVFVVKRCKTIVHDGFHAVDKHPQTIAQPTEVPHGEDESTPLVRNETETKVRSAPSAWQRVRASFSCHVVHQPTRAACTGALAGATCGLVGIFLPHTMFWGEAQLQNLIDKGRTPLPVFGASSTLTVYACCMIDPNDKDAVRAGFGIGCAAAISLAKTVVIGLSLGTGIIGGQFWGPLFVGCAASHLFTDLIELFHSYFGFGRGLATHPCVIILCTMAAAHVVTFRAHLAIMLILTLTISAFNPESEFNASNAAGDYSAVLPLLVIAGFVSLMAARDTVVYATQRSRGDITAVPEVLCRPGREGTPMVVDYDHCPSENSSDGSEHESKATVEQHKTPERLEDTPTEEDNKPERRAAFLEAGCTDALSSARLDEILGIVPSLKESAGRAHKRTHSAPSADQVYPPKVSTSIARHGARNKVSPARSRSGSGGSQKGLLVHVSSFGEVHDHQPSLLEQAQYRSASSADSKHRRVPSLPTDPKPPRKGHHARASSLTSGKY